jgi:hypothetical protein
MLTERATNAFNQKIGFLDCELINCEILVKYKEAKMEEVEQYTLAALLKLQDKDFILLPYNFQYVFSFLVI